MGLEGEAAPWDLEDAEGVAHVTVTPMALPHANPGLELDSRLLLDDIDLQQVLPPLKNPPPQACSPPDLNHPGREGSHQQGATHQGAPPPGLDLPSRLDSRSEAFFTKPLTKQSRGLHVNLSQTTTSLASATKEL